MKAPKASKRLAKIEVLLSNVIDRYAPSEQSARQALLDAKSAIVHARKTVVEAAKWVGKKGQPKEASSICGERENCKDSPSQLRKTVSQVSFIASGLQGT